MTKFPYAVQRNNIIIINNELTSLESSARLSYGNDQEIIFSNPNPKEKEPVFGDSKVLLLEEYLSDPKNCEALINDINGLRNWLVREGYLYLDTVNYVATSLMLRTHSLTK